MFAVCLGALVCPPSVSARPRVCFGGQAGRSFEYGSRLVAGTGLSRPDHLNGPGGYVRIPALRPFHAF